MALPQKFTIQSPESPCIAEIRLTHGRWQVFFGFKPRVPWPKGLCPHYSDYPTKEEAEAAGKKWANEQKWSKA